MRELWDHGVMENPAYKLVAEAWANIVDLDLTTPGDILPPIYDDTRVLFCMVDGEPLGVLVYHVEDEEYCMALLYVEPSSRRQGIATELITDLLGRAQGATVYAELPKGSQSTIDLLENWENFLGETVEVRTF